MSNARWSEKRCRVPLLAEGQFSSNVVLRDHLDDECARLLGCGFHRCQKLCHAGAGLVRLSAVKIASYGMSVSAYAVPRFTFAEFASASSMYTTLSCTFRVSRR